MRRKRTILLLVSSILPFVFSCSSDKDSGSKGEASLVEIARSDRQWTGVAVTHDGRIFVNYPRWSDNVPFSVGEVMPDGDVKPYPNEIINRWDGSQSPQNHFICVQSVYVDRENILWILDTGNPQFTGVIQGGPKLIAVDPAINTIIRTYNFSGDVVRNNSYLNDVRIDTRLKYAYISDSDAGGIVVVNLNTGASHRTLADHPSALSEEIVLTIGGKEWRRPDGSLPQVHTDGIALSPDGRYVYYQALTGRSLYRIESNRLRDRYMTEDKRGEYVELVAKSGAADGIAFGPEGNLYLSAIEEDAVNVLTPDGAVKTIVSDPRLLWPDSFSITPDGDIYVTTSQIHLGSARTEPYMIYRLK